MSASALTGATHALAEPWPPSTPPRVDLGEAPRPVAPVPAPPLPAPAPADETPPESEPKAPAPTAADSASAAGVIAVTAAAPARRDSAVGSSDGQLYLRTSRDELVLLPTARVELNGQSIAAPDPYSSQSALAVDQARVDLAGWLISRVYVQAAVELAHGPSLRHVDNYVALEPWGDRLILQAGQFDVPFTLENRTPDRYLDLLDRGAAIRAFAIPENKDQGVMLHGTTPARSFGYAAGVFNGAGPEVEGVDSDVDFAARAWVAPFSFRDPDALRAVTVGGSVWTGDRAGGPLVTSQTTEGGYAAFIPNLWWMSGAGNPPRLREQGRVNAVALEVNAPFEHRFGLRFEWIAKRQGLAAFTTSDPARPMDVGGLTLSGWASYAEIWCWALGDDRILGAPAAPGMGLPVRLSDFGETHPRNGLMLVARVDYIDETLTASSSARGIGVGSVGETQLTAYTLGATYWYTRRARFTANYVYNRFGGETPYVNGLQGRSEQELLARLTLAL